MGLAAAYFEVARFQTAFAAEIKIADKQALNHI